MFMTATALLKHRAYPYRQMHRICGCFVPTSLAPSSFLFLVARPEAPSSVLAPSSDALCS